MRGEDDGAAGGELGAEEDGEGGAGLGVKALEGFVKEEDVRLLREGGGEEHAARLAAGEGAGVGAGERLEAGRGDCAAHGLLVAARERAEEAGVREASRGDRGAHGKAGERAGVGRLREPRDAARVVRAGNLRDRDAVQQHASGARRERAGEGAQKRRLADAVRPDEDGELAGRERRGESFDHRLAPETDREPLATKHVRGGGRYLVSLGGVTIHALQSIKIGFARQRARAQRGPHGRRRRGGCPATSCKAAT